MDFRYKSVAKSMFKVKEEKITAIRNYIENEF